MKITINDKKELERIEKEYENIDKIDKKHNGFTKTFEGLVRRNTKRLKTASDFIHYSKYFEALFNEKKNFVLEENEKNPVYDGKKDGKKDIWAGKLSYL